MPQQNNPNADVTTSGNKGDNPKSPDLGQFEDSTKAQREAKVGLKGQDSAGSGQPAEGGSDSGSDQGSPEASAKGDGQSAEGGSNSNNNTENENQNQPENQGQEDQNPDEDRSDDQENQDDQEEPEDEEGKEKEEEEPEKEKEEEEPKDEENEGEDEATEEPEAAEDEPAGAEEDGTQASESEAPTDSVGEGADVGADTGIADAGSDVAGGADAAAAGAESADAATLGAGTAGADAAIGGAAAGAEAEGLAAGAGAAGGAAGAGAASAGAAGGAASGAAGAAGTVVGGTGAAVGTASGGWIVILIILAIFVIIAIIIIIIVIVSIFKRGHLDPTNPNDKPIIENIVSLESAKKIEFTTAGVIDQIKKGDISQKAAQIMIYLSDKHENLQIGYLDSSTGSSDTTKFEIEGADYLKCTDTASNQKFSQIPIWLSSSHDWTQDATVSNDQIICAEGYYPRLETASTASGEFPITKLSQYAPPIAQNKMIAVTSEILAAKNQKYLDPGSSATVDAVALESIDPAADQSAIAAFKSEVAASGLTEKDVQEQVDLTLLPRSITLDPTFGQKTISALQAQIVGAYYTDTSAVSLGQATGILIKTM